MNAKQIVYRYDGDPASEELEADLDGNVLSPERDAFIMRKGKRWKVVHVIEERELTRGAVPVVRVFLSDQP